MRSAKRRTPPPRLRPVIEALEPRAMLAGVGPESWSAGGIGSPLMGAGALSTSGIILTCSSPTPGSSGTASLPGSTGGSGGSASGGVLWLPSTAGSGAGTPSSGSAGTVNTNGPALSSQVSGGSGAGGQGANAGSGSSAQGGNDLWLPYSAGSGPGTSSSGSTGTVNTNGPALSSRFGGGSGPGGQGASAGTGSSTQIGDEFWLSYRAGSGAGTSPSGSAGTLNTNGPALASQVGGGSVGSQSAPPAASGSGGLSVVLFDSAQPSMTGSGTAPGSTGSNTLTLEEGVPPPRLTPLVFHPGSDDGPGIVSGVWTGDGGGVQFVLTAEQEKNQASQPLPIGKPGTPVFIVSGSQPGSQVPYSGTTATTTPLDGGSVVPPSGGASYSVFSAVGGLLNVIGGACQAAVGVNVVIAASAATVATEGGASPLTVPIAIGGSVVVVHGLDQVWAGVTTIYTGQTQRPYTAQALDPLTGNETTSDRINGGFGIVLSGGAGLLARGTQVAGQVASKGDEIAAAVGTIAGRGDDAVGVVDDVAGSAGSSSAGVASGSLLGADDFASLPKSGRIDPKTIRFSQDSIAPDFKGGVGGVEDLAAKLKAGQVDPSTIPPIRIVVKDGKVFTLDNRRLRAFQEAGIDIPFERLDSIPKSELFKFTTKTDGVDIIIRGANQ